MAKATWNGVVLAESDDTVIVEGNHYFPADSVHWDRFESSDTPPSARGRARPATTTSSSTAQTNADAAWYYPEPKDAAAEIKDRVAFWKGVTVEA